MLDSARPSDRSGGGHRPDAGLTRRQRPAVRGRRQRMQEPRLSHPDASRHARRRRRRERRPRCTTPTAPTPAAADAASSRSCGWRSLLLGLGAARAGLDGLRDDDGGRPRPARRSRTARSTRTRSELGARRRARPARSAILTGNQNRILVSYGEISPEHASNAVIAIEDRRFYEHKGVDCKGIGRALVQDVAAAARRAGRLDDHAAVREERARGAERPDRLPEAARGRARLPPRAQVVEGEDPHRVPEHDLLRQRRLRDRGRPRGRTSASQHPGCGTRARPLRARARAVRGGAAGRR